MLLLEKENVRVTFEISVEEKYTVRLNLQNCCIGGPDNALLPAQTAVDLVAFPSVQSKFLECV